MKKIIYILSILFLSLNLSSQPIDVEEYLNMGKAEFYKEWDEQNYAEAVRNLEKAVQLDPNNQEALYFLSYAYDRLNSKDGSTMINVDYELTLKSSLGYERVIELSPKYEGEVVALDPYSRLSSIWGSQAMAYLYKGKTDSAKLCFEEGRKRGGFSGLFLAAGRKTLDFCKKDAYLMTMGDNVTFPLWYLQTVEEYRTDVTVVDVNMLNTLWYPKYLININQVEFTYSKSELDSLSYEQWETQTISISDDIKQSDFTHQIDYSWEAEPAYADAYMLRADLLLLDILKQNKFRRDINFSMGYHPKAMLSLNSYLKPKMLVDFVDMNNPEEFDDEEFYKTAQDVLSLSKAVNVNSQDELGFLDMLRYIILDRIYVNGDEINTAYNKKLFKLMTSTIPQNKYPVQSKNLKEYLVETESKLK